jgi:hypothetical protein
MPLDKEIKEGTFLVIDPGITTGFVYGEFEDTVIKLHPFQKKVNCYELSLWLEFLRPENIICEDFEFRRGLDWVELFPVQLIGVVNCFVESYHGYHAPILKMQKAATVFGHGAYFNDKKKLQELVIYKPQTGGDKNHMMEAMRHFAYWYHFGAGHRYFDENKKLTLMGE